ncbi:MAG: hypothetical protein LBG92_12725 [Prevotellaceae bacterium]|jgi:hypothetical protein|nr:hypothetical protein [Prevotellaceae bacterium]
MTEQIENILNELKALQAQLFDLFWLKIDRYNEADKQRGVLFDEKFKQQHDKLSRIIDNFSANQMCISCKKLLDIYGIAHSEMKIYLDRIPAKI